MGHVLRDLAAVGQEEEVERAGDGY